MRPRQGEPRVQTGRIGPDDRLAQGDRPPLAGDGALGVAEIGHPDPALDRGDPLERPGELGLEGGVVAGLPLEAFQVLETDLDDPLAHRRRSRERGDLRFDLEDERPRQPPHLVEAAFGDGALGARDAGLAARLRRARRKG